MAYKSTTIPPKFNTKRTYYFFSQTQPSACCSNDRKLPKSPLALTDNTLLDMATRLLPVLFSVRAASRHSHGCRNLQFPVNLSGASGSAADAVTYNGPYRSGKPAKSSLAAGFGDEMRWQLTAYDPAARPLRAIFIWQCSTRLPRDCPRPSVRYNRNFSWVLRQATWRNYATRFTGGCATHSFCLPAPNVTSSVFILLYDKIREAVLTCTQKLT